MDDAPDISVVIPVRNGADTIGQQLAALAAQRVDGAFEVIISDNGSADDTILVAQSWADRVPGLVVVDSSDRPGAAHARNVGVTMARGAVVAFCDADDVVGAGWLEAMLAATATSELVTGAHEHSLLNDALAQSWVPASNPDPLRNHLGFLPFASSANLAIHRRLFEELGGFDEEYTRGEDVDLSWRAIKGGARFAADPRAVVHYRFRTDLQGSVNQSIQSGLTDVQLYRAWRSSGLTAHPSYAVKAWGWIVLSAPRAVVSAEWRGRWLRTAAYRVGRIRGSVRHRVLFP